MFAGVSPSSYKISYLNFPVDILDRYNFIVVHIYFI